MGTGRGGSGLGGASTGALAAQRAVGGFHRGGLFLLASLHWAL